MDSASAVYCNANTFSSTFVFIVGMISSVMNL